LLSALTGTCYWWGWVPTCGLTALLSASAFQQWYFPWLPVEAVAIIIVCFFSFVNLCGIKWVARLAIPIATASASLAFISALTPMLAGDVNWTQAFDYHLTTPFEGWFGELTSIMAGLYLIGFAAPAFEAAACHVGETVDPNRNVPRAMLAAAAMAGVYFIVLPVVWLGVLGPEPLGHDLAVVLGPTFAPLFGSFGKAAAIWFVMFNMFHGTLQPLAGAARTLSQLSDDGLLPRFLSWRIAATDCPWTATSLTAGSAIIFLLAGDPVWMIAAANFTYLIGICMPNIAAWLLRRDQPNAERPYRAPRGTIMLGVVAACIWLLAAVLGFQQFGLPTVVFGLALAYSGAALYAWRVVEDRLSAGLPAVA
jgi:amino acid transporter